MLESRFREIHGLLTRLLVHSQARFEVRQHRDGEREHAEQQHAEDGSHENAALIGVESRV